MIERMGVSRLSRWVIARCGLPTPRPAVLRLFVSVLLLAEPPPGWRGGRAHPMTLRMSFPTERSRRRAIWDCCRHPYKPIPGWAGGGVNQVPLPEQTAVRRKHIGDAGEQLTVSFDRGA